MSCAVVKNVAIAAVRGDTKQSSLGVAACLEIRGYARSNSRSMSMHSAATPFIHCPTLRRSLNAHCHRNSELEGRLAHILFVLLRLTACGRYLQRGPAFWLAAAWVVKVTGRKTRLDMLCITVQAFRFSFRVYGSFC